MRHPCFENRLLLHRMSGSVSESKMSIPKGRFRYRFRRRSRKEHKTRITFSCVTGCATGACEAVLEIYPAKVGEPAILACTPPGIHIRPAQRNVRSADALATTAETSYCLITVPSRRRITPQPPFRAPRAPSDLKGYLAASFSSTSMPQPGESLA